MKNFIFDLHKNQELQQLIRFEGQAFSFIVDLLFCPDPQFPQILLATNMPSKKILVDRNSNDLKLLSMLKLYNKLSTTDQWKELSEINIFRKLNTFIEILTHEREQRFQFMQLIIDKSPVKESVLAYFDQKICKEHCKISIFPEPLKKIMEAFLVRMFKQAKLELDKQDVQGRKKTLMKLTKIFKVYSYIVDQSVLQEEQQAGVAEEDMYLREKDADQLYKIVPECQNMQLLLQLLEIRSVKSKQLIKGILQTSVLQTEGGYKLKTQLQLPQKMISTQLISAALSFNSNQNYCLDIFQKDDNLKTLKLKYNILGLQEEVFSNLVPYYLIKEEENDYSEQIKYITIIFQNMLDLLTKICEKWKVFVFEYAEGNPLLKECSQQEHIKIVEGCMLIWQNLMKAMRSYNNVNYWCCYASYDKFFDMSINAKQNITCKFQMVLNNYDIPTWSILESVCGLLVLYDEVEQNDLSYLLDDKEFSINLVQKINKRAEYTKSTEVIDNRICWLFLYKKKKLIEHGLQICNFPIHNPTFFKAYYILYFHQGNYDYSYMEGPNFIKYGTFSIDMTLNSQFNAFYSSSSPFQKYLEINFKKELQNILNKINRNQNNQRLMNHIILFLNQENFEETDFFIEKLIEIYRIQPKFIQSQYKESLMKKLKLNNIDNRKQINYQLLQFLKREDLKNVNGKVLIEQWINQTPLLDEFNKISSKWLIQQGSLSNDFIKEYSQIMVQLKQLEFMFKNKIESYLRSLQIAALQNIQYSSTLKSKNIYETYLGQIIQNIWLNLLNVTSQGLKTAYFLFLDNNFAFKMLLQHQDNHLYVRAYSKMLYLFFQEIQSSKSLSVLFYVQNKQHLLPLIKKLYKQYKVFDYFEDYYDTTTKPSFDKQVIYELIEWKKNGKNLSQEYEKYLKRYVFYNVKEFYKQILTINQYCQSQFINGYEIKGSKNMRRLHQSLVVDFLNYELDYFQQQNIPYYCEVISQILDNQQNHKDRQDQGKNEIKIYEFFPKNYEFNILPQNDSEKTFSETMIKFAWKLFQFRRSNIKDINSTCETTVSKILDQCIQQENLCKNIKNMTIQIITKINEFIQEQNLSLSQIKFQLQWLNSFMNHKLFTVNDYVVDHLNSQFIYLFSKFIQQKLFALNQRINERTQKNQQEKQNNDILQDSKQKQIKQQISKAQVSLQRQNVQSQNFNIQIGDTTKVTSQQNDKNGGNKIQQNQNKQEDKDEEKAEVINDAQLKDQLLKLSLPLLIHLVPKISQNPSEQQIQYALSVLKIIVIIIEKTQPQKPELFSSVVLKISNSDHDQILKCAHYFAKKCSDKIGLLLYETMMQKYERMCMEVDIKGFFFSKFKDNFIPIQQTQVSVEQFANHFNDIYHDKSVSFKEQVDKLCFQKSKIQENKEVFYLKYHQKGDFSFLKSINTQQFNFKPPLFVREQIKITIDLITKEQQSIQNLFNQLRLFIFYCPVMLTYIISHPIILQENQYLNKRHTFLDLMIKKVIKGGQNCKHYRKFIETVCLDHFSLIKGKDKQYFLSEYVSFIVVRSICSQPLNMQALKLILCLIKYKSFIKLLSIRLTPQNISIKDIVERELIKSRKQWSYENNNYQMCFVILGIINRYESIKGLSYAIQSKNNSDKMKIKNRSTIHIDPPLTSSEANELEIRIYNNKNQLQTLEDYIQISNKLAQISYIQKVQLLKVDQIFNDYSVKSDQANLRLIGQYPLLKDDYRTNDDFMYNSCQKNLQNMYKQFEDWYDNQNEDKSYQAITKYQLTSQKKSSWELQDHDSQKTQQQNYQLSRFAVEDYTRSRCDKNQEEDTSQLLKCFRNEFIKEQHQDKEITVIQTIESPTITLEMQKSIDIINQNLDKLGASRLETSELLGKTQQEILQKLKQKEVQSEFDLNEAVLNQQQFRTYCLSNAIRLQRLSNDRKDKVRHYEEVMLQKLLRRKTSDDEIDYIIDTLDENYQMLPKMQRAKTKQEQVSHKDKNKVRYFSLDQISQDNFPHVSQELLYQLMISLYFEVNTSFRTLFIENPKSQGKIINTLLYIIRKPFTLPEFPSSIKRSKPLQDVLKQEEQDLKFMKAQIVQLLYSLHSYGFYENEKYLLQQISYEGVKNIQLSPHPELGSYFNEGKHIPMYQVLAVSLDSHLSIPQKVRLLRGIQISSEYLLNKIISFIELMNAQFNNLSKPLDQIGSSFTTLNQYRQNLEAKKNFSSLMKSNFFRIKMREVFPLNVENVKIDYFTLSLFVSFDLYSDQELKKYHQIFLSKKQIKQRKTSQLFFANQMLVRYSDQELQQAAKVSENIEFYKLLVKKISADCSKLGKIKQQPFYRLFNSKNILPLSIKKILLEKQIQEIKEVNSFSLQNDEIVSKRQKGIFESAFQELRHQPEGFWLYDFDIKFMNRQGQLQSGYGSGVAREWFTLVTKGMVNLNYGLFVKTSKNVYYFNRESWVNPRHLQFFEFIGKLFAFSIVRQDMVVCPSFSIILYKMLLGEDISMKDIVDEFDEGEVIENVEKMRDYQDDSLFCESFVYADKRLMSKSNLSKTEYEGQNTASVNKEYLVKDVYFPDNQEQEETIRGLKVLKVGQQIELLPGGANIYVTKENLEEFIKLTQQKIFDMIVKQVSQQAAAFKEGFNKVFNLRHLRNFTAKELRLMVEGTNKISVEELKTSAKINVGDKCKKSLKWFWLAFEELSTEDQLYFIQHWTGALKVPAEGIKEMGLHIHDRVDEKKRIFSHTCFNRIYIPNADAEEEIREAVKMAVISVKKELSIQED